VKRRFSAATRKLMSQRMKERWAKKRAAKPVKKTSKS
jgi:hypothetical protein